MYWGAMTTPLKQCQVIQYNGKLGLSTIKLINKKIGVVLL
jgi:hypothetical protein